MIINTDHSLIIRAIGLGIATGSRSQIANGVLAWHHDDGSRCGGWRSWPVFRSSLGGKILIVASLGELVGDKLPMTPSRLEPATLAGRIALGTLAGAAIGTEYGDATPIMRGAIFSTVGSVIGNYGGYHARKAVVEATGLPDPAVAVVEDLIAVTLASDAVRS